MLTPYRGHGLVEEADFVQYFDKVMLSGVYDSTKSCLVHSLVALAFTGRVAPPSMSNRADHDLAVLHFDKAIAAANKWRRNGCSILMFKVRHRSLVFLHLQLTKLGTCDSSRKPADDNSRRGH